MTLIEDVAAARAVDPLAETWLEMECFNPDEFDTTEMDIPIVVREADGDADRARRRTGGPKDMNRRHPNERVRCACPPLAPYPPGWLTARQWDALDAIRAAFPTADWNPHTNLERVGASLAELLARVPLAAGCRVVSDIGGCCWVNLATPALGEPGEPEEVAA